VLEKVLDSVTASLMPKVHDAAVKIAHARDEVDKVRTKIIKGIAALESLPKNLPDVAFDIKHPKDSINKIKGDWNPIVGKAKDAWNGASLHDAGPAPTDQLESSFPLPGRVAEAEASAVTEDHLKIVLPLIKWKGAPKAKEGDAEAGADGGDSTPESLVKNGGGSVNKPQIAMDQLGGVPSSQKSQSLMKPFDYSEPLPAALPIGQVLASNGPISTQDPQQFAQAFKNIDPEETVDLPGSAMSVLLPFQGKKA